MISRYFRNLSSFSGVLVCGLDQLDWLAFVRAAFLAFERWKLLFIDVFNKIDPSLSSQWRYSRFAPEKVTKFQFFFVHLCLLIINNLLFILLPTLVMWFFFPNQLQQKLFFILKIFHFTNFLFIAFKTIKQMHGALSIL